MSFVCIRCFNLNKLSYDVGYLQSQNIIHFSIYRNINQTDVIITHNSTLSYLYSYLSYLLKISFLNLIFFGLERISLNIRNHQHELNIIYEIIHKNNFN